MSVTQLYSRTNDGYTKIGCCASMYVVVLAQRYGQRSVDPSQAIRMWKDLVVALFKGVLLIDGPRMKAEKNSNASIRSVKQYLGIFNPHVEGCERVTAVAQRMFRGRA